MKHDHVFLSYSRNDPAAAVNLRAQLERCGLSVFKDDETVRAGELCLDRLQEAIGACGAFVVLVGSDGVRRWIGAETQTALNRYFGPRDDAERLPIFPILLDGTGPETLPAFLRLFQMTPWNGADPLPEPLLTDIRERIVVPNAIPFEGCPFVGLAVYRPDQAHLFFGRQKETLDALACFDTRLASPTVCWLEVNGNSGSGKSSLMQAGLLPLIDQGWLWPRTGYAKWRRIGPMMAGERPVTMLAEQLARAFDREMADVRTRLEANDDRALADWLRGRKQDETAFLLAIDQFEELFTFADPDERRRFDRLLAAALEDADCPLFVISTVRSDFLDRFAEDLPRLVAVRNRLARPWTLAPIGPEGLREIIEGPARWSRRERNQRSGGNRGAGRAGRTAAGRERAAVAVGEAYGQPPERSAVHRSGRARRDPQQRCRRPDCATGQTTARASLGTAFPAGPGRFSSRTPYPADSPRRSGGCGGWRRARPSPG